MKIDFHAPYGALERILRNPARLEAPQSERKGNFEKLLADIAPKSGSYTKMLGNSNGPGSLGPTDMQRAMLPFPMSEPSLLEPELREIYPLPKPDAQQEVASGTVKTPTLLRLQRITPENISEIAPSSEPAPVQEVPSPEKISLEEIRASVRRAPMAPMEEIQRIVNRSGKEMGIDPALGLAVIEAESGFDPRAISKDGHASKGLMQLLDTTGKEILKHLGEPNTEYNPFDPEQNVQLGVRYLRRLHDYFSESTELRNGHHTRAAANISSLERMAVAAFNAGEGRVAHAQRQAERAGRNPAEYDNIESFLPSITQNYVRKVMSYRELHASNMEPGALGFGEG